MTARAVLDTSTGPYASGYTSTCRVESKHKPERIEDKLAGVNPQAVEEQLP